MTDCGIASFFLGTTAGIVGAALVLVLISYYGRGG